MNPPTVRLSGCHDVVAAAPYLTGFHPREAIVIIAIGETRAAMVTAHFSLTDADRDQAPNVAPIVGSGAREARMLVYDAMDRASHIVAAARVQFSLIDAGLSVHLVKVDTDHYTCSCTDGHPRRLPGNDTPVVTALIAAGMSTLPTRADVAAQLAPIDDTDALDRVQRQLVALISRCHTHPDPTDNPILDDICDRATSAVRSADPQHLPPPKVIADLAMAACEPEFHDLVTHEAAHHNPDRQLALWTWVTRHLPPGIVAPSATLRVRCLANR